jgi:hypothetical protein
MELLLKVCVEEALHKRARWGVPRALCEWDVCMVVGGGGLERDGAPWPASPYSPCCGASALPRRTCRWRRWGLATTPFLHPRSQTGPSAAAAAAATVAGRRRRRAQGRRGSQRRRGRRARAGWGPGSAALGGTCGNCSDLNLPHPANRPAAAVRHGGPQRPDLQTAGEVGHLAAVRSRGEGGGCEPTMAPARPLP